MALCFSTLYPCLSGCAEVLVQWLFFRGLLGKKASPLRILPLVLLSCLGVSLAIPVPCKFLLLAILLFLYGTFFCGRPKGLSLFSAFLATGLTQLCYGIFQPILPFLAFLLCPANPALCGTFCMVAGDFSALGLALLCGRAILRHSTQWGCTRRAPLLPAVVPLLLVFFVSSSIAHSFYGNTVVIDPLHPAPSLLHLPMLLVQLLGISSVFCILHTHQKTSVLAAQSYSHAKYAAETQARWNQAKALRHDMKNHIAVTRGLLEKGDSVSAAAYLASLDAAAACLSAPFQTNRPACDVLLAEKSALAETHGIAFRSTFLVPAACPVEDMDFCAILANALDNAIHACDMLPAGAEKFIRISSRTQGDFLLVSIENSFRGSPHIRFGTGLSNIRRIAGKYNGALDVHTADSVFCLYILLSISQHPSRIPRQSR